MQSKSVKVNALVSQTCAAGQKKNRTNPKARLFYIFIEVFCFLFQIVVEKQAFLFALNILPFPLLE